MTTWFLLFYNARALNIPLPQRPASALQVKAAVLRSKGAELETQKLSPARSGREGKQSSWLWIDRWKGKRHEDIVIFGCRCSCLRASASLVMQQRWLVQGIWFLYFRVRVPVRFSSLGNAKTRQAWGESPQRSV